MKQRMALFGMVTVALIFASCDGDSGNNGVETEGDSSSSVEMSSSGVQTSSSSAESSSSSLKGSSSSSVVSSSSAKAQSSSSAPLSSSTGMSSSSSVEVSSSSVAVCSNTYGANTVTDCRDDRTYKTVVIGTQTWMAENLNYADSVTMPNLKKNSWCYRDSLGNCAKYGRLYTWTAAMDIDSSYQSETADSVVSSTHQGVCPSGWHLPDTTEWRDLEAAVGGESTAGMVLKSTSDWQDDGKGTDSYGFSALPVGYRGYYDGSFYGAVSYAYFWSATGHDESYAYSRDLTFYSADMGTSYDDKGYAYSVRCVKD